MIWKGKSFCTCDQPLGRHFYNRKNYLKINPRQKINKNLPNYSKALSKFSQKLAQK